MTAKQAQDKFNELIEYAVKVCGVDDSAGEHFSFHLFNKPSIIE